MCLVEYMVIMLVLHFCNLTQRTNNQNNGAVMSFKVKFKMKLSN